MANDKKYQFLYSKVPMLSMVDCQVQFGTAGAVTSFTGAGVLSVTLLTTGIYKFILKEDYNFLVGIDATMLNGITGGVVTDGSFVTGTYYQILTLGTTNWAAIGLDASLTPTIGQTFVATGVGGAGGGTANVVRSSAILSVEANTMTATNGMLSPLSNTNGSIFNVSLYNSGNAAAAPTLNSGMLIEFYLRNSSVAY